MLPPSDEICLTIVQYIDREPLRHKPTAHVSYHEGLHLIRKFLLHASHHTVEELQAFTSQWVPSPRWVRVEDVAIPQSDISRAAEVIQRQLGHHGIDRVGGKKWWQWRMEGSSLKAEWIEMRGDYNERKKNGTRVTRVMLYVHGGAYFFGSVDEHRYQMQRHARKLKARVLARILVTLRDQGLPLPAGAILISPWVDLTHSFPSVAGDSSMDYIPAHGFLHRPSEAWPPPNNTDMLDVIKEAVGEKAEATNGSGDKEAVQGFSVDADPDLSKVEGRGGDGAAAKSAPSGTPGNTVPGPGHDVSIMIDGKVIEIKDQIQMYATNQLISHPLVSPVLQPSLGGLPPLFILTGGGEVLRDEQIYLAHKAASPSKYPPGDAYMDLDPASREALAKWKGTDVQLQVWDDCCHVAPTLSFTRPAKYMYRSIAQFGAWALARAQKTEIEILDDDDVSVVSSESGADERSGKDQYSSNGRRKSPTRIGKAGDHLPAFRNHMIRERVDRHGNIYPLPPATSLPALQLPPGEVGVVKPGPVRRWMTAKKEWDSKYAREKRRVQKDRAKAILAGFEDFEDDDAPPPSALAARRRKNMPREAAKSRSWGMSLWSLWGSSHDEKTIEREEKADRELQTTTASAADGGQAGSPGQYGGRSRSRRRTVRDLGQASGSDQAGVDENTTVAELVTKKGGKEDPNLLNPSLLPPSPRSGQANGTRPVPASGRPNEGGVAYPFKLATRTDEGANASMMTLTSAAGVVDPAREKSEKSVQELPLGEDKKAADGEGGPDEKGPADEKRSSDEKRLTEEKRPEPERFVTASDGLTSAEKWT
ncbi:MAG: hypothetical protein M1832_006195 [Thelocarpon impressellum]|nr:MAG: hypothetical protein M1832_006195 [Thelocarpon impressellum]